MNEAVRQAIVDGAPGVSVTVSAADLRQVLGSMMEAERRRMTREVAAEREKATMARAEVMEILGVSETTLVRWDNNGYLKPVKVGRRVLYRRGDIDALLRKRPDPNRQTPPRP